jgi:hypothetical protein
MRLFKRKKPEISLCPRCSQLVRDADGSTCPMCGWDLRDAYQGPSYQAPGAEPSGDAPATIGPTDRQDDETSSDPRTV